MLKQHKSVDTKPGVEKAVVKFIFCCSMLFGIEEYGEFKIHIADCEMAKHAELCFMLTVYTCILLPKHMFDIE